MDAKNIRYIVFMLNPDVAQYTSDGQRIDTHDGKIFVSKNDAREYAMDAIKDGLCSRFVIGVTNIDPYGERNMQISMVETFGFRNDKKNVVQLSLFK